MTDTATVEKKEDIGTDEKGIVKRWLTELKLWKKREEKWHERAEKVIKRYRDERENETNQQKKLNLLWSNVETLRPALYFKTPKPQIDRRFRDKDPIGLAVGKILERACEYALDAYDFDSLARDCVEDYLLPGRTTARVVYKPTYGDTLNGDDGQPRKDEDGKPLREVVYEAVECDYVFWKDFAVGPGRRWEDVPWVGFRSYLDREEGVKRFGQKFNDVNLDHEPEGLEDEDNKELFKKATVWEIWSKKDNKVYFIAPAYKDAPLEVTDPPLRLRKFFPCPKPLQSVKTNDKLTPIPEFSQYQDQADEIDKITARIDKLTESLKVVGAYAGSNTELQRIFTEGHDNALVPIEDWAMFADKGGVANAISWFPVGQVIKVLKELYVAREQLKQGLYEVTGIADIIRGVSNPNETLGAQEIKQNFAGQRIKDRQAKVAEFFRDLIELKAEVIAEQFSPQTLQLMTGVQLPTMQQKQAAGAQGQQLPIPTWEEVMQILQNDPIRTFKIDIESDSTILIDDKQEKESRTEFLTAATGFMEKAVPLAQAVPEIKPLLGEMLMFGVRGFRAGRDLESAFEKFTEQLNQPPQPPPPDPKLEAAKVKAQADIEKTNTERQITPIKAQAETVKAQAEVVKANAAMQTAQVKAATPRIPQ